MDTRLVVAAAYFMLLFVILRFARTRVPGDSQQYFLAGRSLRFPVLLMTMAATNFSAFTVFGASGAGYRDGLAFLPVMAFGTGFMALTFLIIGRRAWRLGAEGSLVTPSDLINQVYRSKSVAALSAIVLLVFTVPYLALQPVAAGNVIGHLFGVPEWVGATVVTATIVLYTVRGGMRAVAWTDVLQGLLALVVMLVALGVVVHSYGGWERSLSAVAAQEPALFSRPGLQGSYTPAIWFSYLALWFYCDPMFPQLFQRFYAADSARTLGRVAFWYPAICALVFAPPVIIGVLGHLSFPGLSGKEADGILAMVATGVAGDLAGTLVLVAGLAALMSTMDSQLLTLSSIISRDLWPLLARGHQPSVASSRMFVALLAGAGLLVAVTTNATILDLGITAFTGFAVLFPTVLFGLYVTRPRPAAAMASIVSGEAVVVASYFGLLPSTGFLSAVPAMLCATLVYLVVQLATDSRTRLTVSRGAWPYLSGFALLFILAHDFWNWGDATPVIVGLPRWLWYFLGLAAAQMLLTALLLRNEDRNSTATEGRVPNGGVRSH